jgi:16S rRNA (guanine(527)-N(7))-methyltransferase RsmG
MTSPPALQLQKILSDGGQFYGRRLSETDLQRFSIYFQLVLKWNNHLHLTTIVQPLAFAQYHIFESVFAESHLLPSIHKIWDFGSGLGIPGIPITILRPDLSIILVEANKKKTIFLKEVADALKLANLTILNQRFELMTEVESESCVTVRAIEQMNRLIPKILMIGKHGAQFLFFGSGETESIILRILPPNLKIQSFLIPSSQNRFLISLTRST